MQRLRRAGDDRVVIVVDLVLHEFRQALEGEAAQVALHAGKVLFLPGPIEHHELLDHGGPMALVRRLQLSRSFRWTAS